VTDEGLPVRQPPRDYTQSRMMRLIKVVSIIVFSYNKHWLTVIKLLVNRGVNQQLHFIFYYKLMN